MILYREIHPIGHGCFITEIFNDEKEKRVFRSVYDCGTSNDIKTLENEIKKTFKEEEIIDLLFISHFDNDHVNGLELLAANKNLSKDTRVIIPFVCPKCILLLYPKMLKAHDDIINILNRYKITPITLVDNLKETEDNNNDKYESSGYDGSVYNINELRGISSIKSCSIIKISLSESILWQYIPFHLISNNKVFKACRSLSRNGNFKDLQKIIHNRKQIRADYERLCRELGIGNINRNSLMVISKGMNDNYLESTVYTGDGYLKEGYKYKSLQTFKSIVSRYTKLPMNLMQLPHHGSSNNYSSKIFNESYAREYFTCQSSIDRMYSTYNINNTYNANINVQTSRVKSTIKIVTENQASRILEKITL